MLARSPVQRLSMPTTLSPRSRSRSQRCDPRNPAAPVTTIRLVPGRSYPTRSGMAQRAFPGSGRQAHALVAETQPDEPGAVEGVPGVDHPRAGHQPADALEVERAELVPLGQDDEDVGL